MILYEDPIGDSYNANMEATRKLLLRLRHLHKSQDVPGFYDVDVQPKPKEKKLCQQ